MGAPGFEPGIIFCWKGNSPLDHVVYMVLDENPFKPPLDHVVYMVLDENPFKRLKGFSSSTIYTTWSSGGLKGFSSSTIYTTWSSGEFPFQQNMIPGSNPGAPTHSPDR